MVSLKNVVEVTQSLEQLFIYGVPYCRHLKPDDIDRFKPLRFPTWGVVYDTRTRGPACSMHRITEFTIHKNVDRKDDFLPDCRIKKKKQSRKSDYEHWNQENPKKKYDIGHQCGSQFRRGSEIEQHYIDRLVNCAPETAAMNRFVKNPLECAILKRAGSRTEDAEGVPRLDFVETFYVAGPIYRQGVADKDRPKLRSGQWIPDSVFISVLWIPRTQRVHSHTFLMDNAHDRDEVNLREISLDELETRSGLFLWGNVDWDSFLKSRSDTRKDDWWK